MNFNKWAYLQNFKHKKYIAKNLQKKKYFNIF